MCDTSNTPLCNTCARAKCVVHGVDAQGGSLTDKVVTQLTGLQGMHACLKELHAYVGLVATGQLPVNHEISYLLQNVFNLLPNMDGAEFVGAMTRHTSDQMLVVYLSALVRSTIALHNLINNKLANQRAEREKDAKAAAAAAGNGAKKITDTGATAEKTDTTATAAKK